MSEAATKACPFCAETIKAAAVLCRFCGRDLPAPVNVAAPAPLIPSAALAAASEGDLLHRTEVLDLLTALVQKSLAVYEEGAQGHGRYRLLETVRQYARDRLADADEADGVRERHLAFFLRLAEGTAPALRGTEQLVWLERLDREHDNVRAALDWAEESGQAQMGLHLAGAIAEFWLAQGLPQEGIQRLEAMLAMPSAAPQTPARAQALRAAGWLRYQHHAGESTPLLEESLALERQFGNKPGIAQSLCALGSVFGDTHWKPRAIERAQQLLQESLAIFSELGDRMGMANALRSLGMLPGDLAAGRALLQESLAITREFGDKSEIAWGLWGLAHNSWRQGDREAARRHFEEALTLSRENRDKLTVSQMLRWLGPIALQDGDRQTARAYLEEALRIHQESGDKSMEAETLQKLGHVARHEGDAAAAARCYRQALRLDREMGARWRNPECLEGLAEVACMHGKPEQAVRLFAAAEALGGSRAADAPSIAELRAQLPEELFGSAWSEGRSMSLEHAIAYALEESAHD